jgi:hypothetical protein
MSFQLVGIPFEPFASLFSLPGSVRYAAIHDGRRLESKPRGNIEELSEPYLWEQR